MIVLDQKNRTNYFLGGSPL